MDKMQSLITADNFSGYLFWDANRSEISLEEHAPYIIQRVLEYGSMNDWKLVYNYYGLEKIVNVCKRLRTLEPTSLSFICTISHTKKEDYRCYHLAQSSPTPWNS